MSRYVLGLDIGITSVGWGVIDIDRNEIIKAGVRIFPERTAKDNLTRRTKRGSRRLIRRRQQRILDLKKHLIEQNIIDSTFIPKSNPYEIRVKGIKGILTNDELATALLHIAKRRGVSYDVVEEDEVKVKDLQSTKDIIKQNKQLLIGNSRRETKLICELQYDKLKQMKPVRTTDNVFHYQDYEKEVNEILANQLMSEETKQEIKKIIFRKRQYFEGPGGEKSPTPFGRWYIEGNQIKYMDLIEKMRGKCSVYPNESRAPKMAYTSDLFNFLNDLNNLRIGDRKINEKEKKQIIDNYINEKGSITPNQLAKFLNVELDTIDGFRIDKKNQPLLTKFEGYKTIKDVVIKNELSPLIYENKEYVDQIIEILTKMKGIEERSKAIQSINQEVFNEKTCEILASLNNIKEYHALSMKALNQLIPELFSTNNNQMQILTASGLNKNNNSIDLKKYRAIPFDNTAVLSPVAKRAQNEAIKVVNAIIKEYKSLDSIVIEVARDRNSDEQKKRLLAEQKFGEELNEKVMEIVGNNLGKINTKLRHKIRLYMEQDGKCMYSNKPISLTELINNPGAYEIDHIIPFSISFDDSMSNKALDTPQMNQDKSNKSPWGLFASGKNTYQSFEEFKENALSLKKRNLISKKKLGYLIETRDITKYDVLKEFINRNLVDTRYASRAIMNMMTSYFNAHNIDTKVHTVRGSVTSMFRKIARLNKNREESYLHHAADALIVAALKKQNYFNNILDFFVDQSGNVSSKTTGEIIDLTNEERIFDYKFFSFIKQIRNLTYDQLEFDKSHLYMSQEKIKQRLQTNDKSIRVSISHKVDKKPNRQFTDETVYGIKYIEDEPMQVSKYKDIYGNNGLKLAEIIRSGNDDKLLIKKNDPKTYELLKKIVIEYSHNKSLNPFAEYYKENGYIRKVSLKDDAPVIKSIRYIDSKIGNFHNITHKYEKNAIRDKVALKNVKPYRTDVFCNEEGFYKFITVRYVDIINKKEYYEINQKTYNAHKKAKQIDDNYKFCFSLCTNEIFALKKREEDKPSIWRFLGTNSDDGNIIEAKSILVPKLDDRVKLSIGKKIELFEKMHTDVLGKIYKGGKEEHPIMIIDKKTLKSLSI